LDYQGTVTVRESSKTHHHGQPLPDSRTDARDPRDAAVADNWCWGVEAEGEGHAVEAETEQRSRRRARQSIREHELNWFWLLQQRLRAVSWPHWRLRCILHASASTARPRHGSFQTLITLTRRPLSVSRALHVLSSCVLCLAPPAVDLLVALDRCVCARRARCFCMRISHFCSFRSASSSGLARRRFPSLVP